MEILSGSEIATFISATSLIWASSVVLLMIGLVYFIKYKESSITSDNSNFFLLYSMTIILNILEYVLNLIMGKGLTYAPTIYRIYVFIGFCWNIALIFYLLNYVDKNRNNSKITLSKVIRYSLMAITLIICMFLNVGDALESNGKFYVLNLELYEVYNIYDMLSIFVFVCLVLFYRKKMPKAFCSLCIVTFFIFIGVTAFQYFAGYNVKDKIFIYSLFVLVIFNTTSNQDKELVNRLKTSNSDLVIVNNRKDKIINKIVYQFRQSLNDLTLFNDELYLINNKNIIKNDSEKINYSTSDLMNYLTNFKDICRLELNEKIVNTQYKLDDLTNNINFAITPLANSKKVKFHIFVDEKTLLNYVGDFNKIEKVLINILSNSICSSKEGQSVYLDVSSKQPNQKSIELTFSIKGNSINSNTFSKKLSINDFIESEKNFNNSDLRMIVSNRLLEMLNSKIDMTADGRDVVYSFKVVQGFKDNELYSNVEW